MKIWKYDESLGSKVTSPIGEHAETDGHEVCKLSQKEFMVSILAQGMPNMFVNQPVNLVYLLLK